MIIQDDALYIGQAEDRAQTLLLKYANRHGLIAGATGTGKTVTLQGLVEGFSKAGVPCFVADIKGDLSGLAIAGKDDPPFSKRAEEIGFTLEYSAFPTIFWDVFGKKGHPIRTTISEMGPLLLARLLELNETQAGVLDVAFAAADEEGLLLLDLEDLRALLNHLGEHAKEYSEAYGRVSTASIGSIQRALLRLEQQGGEDFFGEPALQLADFMKIAPGGLGAVNILAADTLMQQPKLYSTFLLWLLSELFENLPEIGDSDKPELVFFFDEAHLLFDDAPKSLVNKIEQLVKLIRSKGVGVYFITQNPADIPDEVLAQLGNRIQHALRAYTPKERKAVKAAAESFRENPAFDTEEIITQLGIGEALVSNLQSKGVPSVVARTLIRPPVSQVGPISDAERGKAMQASPVAGVYDTPINRESAYEILTKRVEMPVHDSSTSIWGTVRKTVTGAEEKEEEHVAATGSRRRTVTTTRREARTTTRRGDSLLTTVTKTVVRSVASRVGREIARGLMKSLLK